MSSMILCTDENCGIGYKNSIPWYSPADFKHFKESTMGKTVIMGYKTWESLPKKPLPGRTNIVLLTREYKHRNKEDNDPSVLFMPMESLPQLLVHNDCIVIGGSEVYHNAIHYVDEIILSKIEGEFECDRFFDIHSYKTLNLELKNVKTLEDDTIVEYWTVLKNKVNWMD